MNVDEVLRAIERHVAAGGLPIKRDKRAERLAAAAAGAAAVATAVPDTNEDDGTTSTPSSDDETPTTQQQTPSHFVAPSPINKFTLEYVNAVAETMARPYVDTEAEQRAVAAYYAGIDAASPTYEAVNALLSGTYKHARRRIPLWCAIDRHPDGSLRCAYNGEVIETLMCERLLKADEEHLTPQSWHRGSKAHPGSDMHHIFIVSKSSNGTRGNFLFGELPTGETAARRQVSHNGAGGCVSVDAVTGFKHFTPLMNLGAVCRATLYALAAYKNTFHRAYFPGEQLAFLAHVASTAPVSEWERHRNQELHRLQGNRNPFIDFPAWAAQIDFAPAFQEFSGRGPAPRDVVASFHDGPGGNRRGGPKRGRGHRGGNDEE